MLFVTFKKMEMFSRPVRYLSFHFWAAEVSPLEAFEDLLKEKSILTVLLTVAS